MKTDFDVIVVGAGNGGLIAAASSAKLGNSTLLIERHNLPGGAATSFTRGRFEFEPSLHELAKYGSKDNPGNIRNIFDWLGIDVEFKEVPDAYRVINTGSNGFDVSMPTGIPNFIKSMEQAVPGSSQSVGRFFKIAVEVAQAFSELTTDPANINMEDIAEKYPLFMKYGTISYQKVLDELQIPKKAQEILMAYWCYIGIPGDEFEFAYMAAMVVSYVALSAYIPVNRSHEISTALIDSLQQNGGEVWFNTEITKLIVQDGEVVGVRTADKDIYAKQVIMNVIPDVVYSKMLDSTDVPIREVKKSNARKIGTSGFLVYLGLNKSAEELGIKDYSTFIDDNWDSHYQFDHMDNLKDNGFFIMNCLNVANPGCSPEGTSILYATQLFFGDSWDDVSPVEYAKLKDKIAEDLISRYEKATGINIRDYIEEIEIATPETFARYLRGPEGEIYGYFGSRWDQMLARTMSLVKEDEPIKNLHFCGGHGYLLDGYSSAYQSGLAAAKLANQNISKETV
ncbi:NAD(P)/FAD-dependent oxidoreductase [Companilactobacillus allii]|uniref:Phytoene dehydrogenase n=1 Tax=Companilactobacillus allii TaxID=1847728 RepID=A0A1P8Q1T0_9LACO|nr:NAD(P)/FAD-dependent oxidoreductase [Companilactobacillus allii]APX71833.1 phytoene dehydrogenase [Companilactobacillus allii]USQ68920.1 NAD(P)/FAD-dependent oxidoreductase [Companilactobacillus allii]